MSYIGPLYIFLKHDKLLYLLANINSEVIEQMFRVSHLEKGLLRLPNGKTVKNINDYKLQVVKQAYNSTMRIENSEWRATDSSQTSVKSVLYNLHNESQTISQASDHQINWYQSTSILQNLCVDRNQNILNLYHAYSCMINSTDIWKDNVFSPVESIQESCNSYIETKC